MNVFICFFKVSADHLVLHLSIRRQRQIGIRDRDYISGKVREGIEAVWRNPAYELDTDRNLYNLYNATTQFLTRNVAEERYEYSERVSRDLLKVFSGATRAEAVSYTPLTLPTNREAYISVVPVSLKDTKLRNA